MNTRCRFAFAFAFILMLALPIESQTVQESMLVSPAWLERHLRSVKILHVGNAADYEAGHIPGAVLVPISSLVVQRDETPNELPPVDSLERLFRAAGISGRGRIVVYSTDPVVAARAWFTLDYLGHGSRSSLLDGGYARWVAEGCATSRDRVTSRTGTFEARVAPQTIARIATVRELVRMQGLLGTRLTIIDARSPAQFTGDEAGAELRRAGHIPGAVNVPLASNFDASGALQRADVLRALYADAGVTAQSANLVYCRTGMQASVTYFVLRYLGYEAALYDGSFVEWSNAGEETET